MYTLRLTLIRLIRAGLRYFRPKKSAFFINPEALVVESRFTPQNVGKGQLMGGILGNCNSQTIGSV